MDLALVQLGVEALVRWTPQQMSCMLEGQPPTPPPPGLQLGFGWLKGVVLGNFGMCFFFFWCVFSFQTKYGRGMKPEAYQLI